MGGKGLGPLNCPRVLPFTMHRGHLFRPSIHHPCLIPCARSKKPRGIREHGNGHGPRLLTRTIHRYTHSTLSNSRANSEKLVSIRLGIRLDEQDAHVRSTPTSMIRRAARLLAKTERGRRYRRIDRRRIGDRVNPSKCYPTRRASGFAGLGLRRG